MSFTFKKATKSTAKLRAALFGPPGAGKTFTARRIAAGLGGLVAVVDTERGSASKSDLPESPQKSHNFWTAPESRRDSQR